jgi:hypothetical protein
MTTKAIGAGIDLSRMTLTTPIARRGCMCCVSTPSGLPKLAEKYAPVVVLHAEEKLRPAPAAWFLERCSLRWATGRGLTGEKVSDEVDAGRLGAASSKPYTHGGVQASALTRPLDESRARPPGLPPEQGFFLRLREEKFARGRDGGSRTYWDFDETTGGLTFWLFYPGSAPPLGILRASEQLEGRDDEVPDEVVAADAAAKLEEFSRAYPGLAAQAEPAEEGVVGDTIQRLKVVSEGVRALLRDDDVLHEGDWERITVYLEGSDPASVAFYRHSTNTFKRWSSVEKDGTHPVVYSAIGSHASLPSADFGFIDVGDRDGPRWKTFEDLTHVVDEPWYGFGGAWGRLGKVRDSTGPLGPGAHWKHPAPRPAV